MYDNGGVQAVYDINNNNRNNDWGDGGFLWIIVLFALFGWGGNGFGWGGNNGLNTAGLGLQGTIDTNFITRDLFATNQNVSNQGCDTRSAVSNMGYQLQNSMQNLSAQLASCCCETNRSIDAVRYENAKNTCDIITAGNMNTRDIIASQNDGFQKILDKMCQTEIQTLRDSLNTANLQLSQQAQSAVINANINSAVNQLMPKTPVPAYLTCSPYESQMFGRFGFNGFNGFGFNNGCCGFNNNCGGCC